jgi:ParB family chromosome partitioning protein
MTRAALKLAIDQIDIGVRLRPVDPSTVEMLAASFRERGQDTRIIVRAAGDRYALVAGAHRLAAAIELQWSWIEAEVLTVSDDEALLVEIDENLIRRELSALDRAIFLVERKAIWERMHPETAPGKARKPKKGNVANIATFATFAKDAARRTGLSDRTIRLATEIAGKLDPQVRDSLRLTDVADNQASLKALADLDPDLQRILALEIVEGRARNLRGAQLSAGLAPRRNIDPDEERFERFLGLWARASRTLRKRIRAYVSEALSDEAGA